MSQSEITYIMKDAVVTMLLIAAPFLAITAVIGLVVSIVQAATQIQEQSIAFILKIVAVGLILIFLGSWIISIMTDYSKNIFENINGMF
ncbi:MAG: flagellar biosynthetic protein FliQ [Eubacteriales bacterium]|nr:flagellar biosynthetic protein FliQ [Eubacteriales bacterium]MDD4421735.1 flagellar biosynthetic protein FliQ [Eubacteriales bacterium]HBR31057.1 EscS/YscS/HrcS family type III secretion system export apparatus protein [Clostridiales bacterium]